jgi:hypothetical protein
LSTCCILQDWREQARDGFRESDLAEQCTHRYKIYAEGRVWSVSKNYILACDSVALVVWPRFHAFFSRGLVPLRHYWPLRDHRGLGQLTPGQGTETLLNLNCSVNCISVSSMIL